MGRENDSEYDEDRNDLHVQYVLVCNQTGIKGTDKVFVVAIRLDHLTQYGMGNLLIQYPLKFSFGGLFEYPSLQQHLPANGYKTAAANGYSYSYDYLYEL